MNTAKSIIYKDAIYKDSCREVSVSVPQAAKPTAEELLPVVNADMPVVDLLPRLLDSPSHTLSVSEGGRELGILTESLLLEGLAKEFVRRDDCALVSLRCAPADYSASRIAMAVEDAGFHLLDLWSGSTPKGQTAVSIRVRCEDPTPVVRSLERYGFEVTDVHSPRYSDAEAEMERLMALQAYLNV